MPRLREALAVHAEEDRRPGEIVPVEPGEAEALLELLEELFEHRFVRPAAKKKKKKDELKRKRKTANRLSAPAAR